MVTNT